MTEYLDSGELELEYPNGYRRSIGVKSWVGACALTEALVGNATECPCKVSFSQPDGRGGTKFFSLDFPGWVEERIQAAEEKRKAADKPAPDGEV